MHTDGCKGQVDVRTTRHNDIAYSIYRALSTVANIEVIREPPIEGSPSLRNDIRVIAMQGAAVPNMDIDLTVRSVALNAEGALRKAQSVRDPLSRTNLDSIVDVITLNLNVILEEWRGAKRNKISAVEGYTWRDRFRALPITTGGYCDPEATQLIRSWRTAMSPSTYSNMIQDISTKLVRYRAYEGKVQIGR